MEAEVREALCRHVGRWGSGGAADIADSAAQLFRRRDVLEPARLGVLPNPVNGCCTTRRFQEDVEPCRLGCDMDRGDSREHYMCCPWMKGLARRHLRLGLASV